MSLNSGFNRCERCGSQYPPDGYMPRLCKECRIIVYDKKMGFDKQRIFK